MDRPIEQAVLVRTRRKRLIQAILVISGIVLLFMVFSAWIRPSVDRSAIQTAVVERGTIEGSISAAGIVLPRFEQSISSPGETRLLAVRKKPGEFVKQGESLLDLDRNELTLSLERTQKELSLKANRQAQVKLDLAHTVDDLNGQRNIKELRLKYLRSKSEEADKMLALGAISRDQFDQTKLEEKIAGIEREELDRSIANARQSQENQLEGITTEVQTLLREKADIRRQLDLLSCKAGHDGVVTWVNEQIGSSIHRGEIIARVADLSSYRVEATLSDIHASRLAVGMPAVIRLNDLTIPGSVETVYPTIENGTAKVSLSLGSVPTSGLRPQLRVDVDLTTSKRDSACTVKKGPFVSGDGPQDIFVIRDNTAYRVRATIGIMNFNEVEIIDGTSPGDEVIISDMSEYRHLSQLRVH